MRFTPTCKVTALALLFTLSQFVFNSAHALDIASYNIRNFDKDERANISTNKPALIATIKEANADLFGVQEIVNQTAFDQLIRQNFPDYDYVLTKCGGAGNQKLGFVFRKSVLKLVSFKEDERLAGQGNCSKGVRPAAIGQFMYLPKQISFTIINLHLKAGGTQANNDVRFRQFATVSQILGEIRSKGQPNIVLTGDFNTTDYVLRNQNHQRYLEFIEQNQLIDFSAEVECTAYWWGGSDDGLETPSILDHVISSESFREKFSEHTVEAQAHCKKVSCRETSAEELGLTYQEVSDHCPLKTSFKD